MPYSEDEILPITQFYEITFLSTIRPDMNCDNMGIMHGHHFFLECDYGNWQILEDFFEHFGPEIIAKKSGL